MKLEHDHSLFADEPASPTQLGVPDSATEALARVIVVTSALHGEGVTTISRRLALGVSRHLGDTLLIDANLRRPLEAPAGSPRRRVGFTEVLLGGMPPDAVIDVDRASALHLMPAGTGFERASALLGSPALRDALSALRTRYRWIFLDAPPAGVYPDAAAACSHADGAVLVVRAEQTRAEVVDAARRSIERGPTPFLGAILNRRQHHIPDWLYRRL